VRSTAPAVHTGSLSRLPPLPPPSRALASVCDAGLAWQESTATCIHCNATGEVTTGDAMTGLVCMCGPGHYRSDVTGACEACPSGSKKDYPGNVNSCQCTDPEAYWMAGPPARCEQSERAVAAPLPRAADTWGNHPRARATPLRRTLRAAPSPPFLLPRTPPPHGQCRAPPTPTRATTPACATLATTETAAAASWWVSKGPWPFIDLLVFVLLGARSRLRGYAV
jgi:hypothetical protein